MRHINASTSSAMAGSDCTRRRRRSWGRSSRWISSPQIRAWVERRRECHRKRQWDNNSVVDAIGIKATWNGRCTTCTRARPSIGTLWRGHMRCWEGKPWRRWKEQRRATLWN